HREKRKQTDVHGNVVLEKGILENGYVVDPVLLYAKLKALFKAYGLHPKRVRLVLNSQNVLMRVVDVKREDIREAGIAAHLDAELGKSLHFPFPKPRVSYHLISQDDKTAKVLAVASDDRLLNDYLDIFDKLRVKEVVFDMPSLALYALYSKTTGASCANMMLVTVYDTYFTIKIFEEDIPIFNLIEEFEGAFENRYEQVENYVERVANYYRNNISRGDKALEKIVFVNQSEQENENRFNTAFAPKPLGLPYEVFRIPDTPTTGGGWNRTSLVAYAAAIEKTGNLEKIRYFDFRLERPLRIARAIKLMLATAFFLFSAVSLLYIPYHALYEDIFIARNMNANLSAQLEDLQAEVALLPTYSSAERDYSNAYDVLIAHRKSPATYLTDLIGLASDVDIVNFLYDAEDAELVVILVGPSQEALEEYLLSVYEAYGVTDGVGTVRWIDGFPAYESVGTNMIEVIFHHA
ncbi:MAG: pilus assembly protein PilM, partial [Bacillota bacterium]|nr:pilus assembly protein PilM [Bacillota bacterium]